MSRAILKPGQQMLMMARALMQEIFFLPELRICILMGGILLHMQLGKNGN